MPGYKVNIKELTITLLLALTCFGAGAQNIAPNPNFESYNACPVNLSGSKLAFNHNINDWYAVTNGTSDFFHTCCNNIAAGVPQNILGYQDALTGNGYVGFYCYTNFGSYREYVGVDFANAMDSTGYYEVSMSASLSDSSKFAIDKLGIFFYTNAEFDDSVLTRLPLSPQVVYSDTVTGKLNWTRLKRIFKPDSSFRRIIIGSFESAPAAIDLGNYPIQASYYYIDSVVIQKVIISLNIAPSFADSVFCTGQSLQLPYYASNFNPHNTFTVQLSDDNGSFANPVNIGSAQSDDSGVIFCAIPNTVSTGQKYRLRIISASPLTLSDTNNFDIKIYQSPAALSTSSNSPICAGQSLYFTANTVTPGVSYQWSGPSNFSANTSNVPIHNTTQADSGIYICTASNAHCSVRDTQLVTVYLTPERPDIITNHPLCTGDTLLLHSNTVTQGVVYSWSGPGGFSAASQNATRTNLAFADAGLYVVTVTLGNCSSSDTEEVVVNLTPLPPQPSSNSPVCAGGVISLKSYSPTTGVNYHWNGPGNFFSLSQNVDINNAAAAHAGVYTVTASLHNCMSSDTVSIIVNPGPTKPTPTSATPTCEGDTVFLGITSPVAGMQYSWTGPSNFIANATNPFIGSVGLNNAGWYLVRAINMWNCYSAPDSLEVQIKPRPTTPELSSNNPVCEKSPLVLNTFNSNASSFSWQGPLNFISALPNPIIDSVTTGHSGWYSATGILDGCHSLPATIFIDVLPLPVPGFELRDNACVGISEELNIYYDFNNLHYDWQFNDAVLADSTFNHYYLQWQTTGDKSVVLTVTGKNGCTATRHHLISVHPIPVKEIEFVRSTSVCTHDTITLYTSYIDTLNYLWQPEKHFSYNTGNEAIAKVPSEGYISLTTSDHWGCSFTDSVFIKTRPCCDIIIPDAFSPNGDGRNDKLRVVTEGYHEVTRFIIINRWGQEVFSTSDERHGWDGSFKGTPQNIGTYQYYIRYKCADENYYEKKGDFLLIR